MQEINTQELESLKKEVDLVLYENQQVVVSSKEEYNKAGDILKLLKNKKKNIEEKRKEHTDPLEQLKKKWIAEFKILTDPIDTTIIEIEKSMTSWYLAEKKRLDEKQKIIDAEALAKAKEEGISEVEVEVVNDIKTQRTNIATTTAINFKNFEILDESLIPREYLVVDESKIREAINNKAHPIREIAGIKIFDDVRLSSRGR